MSGAFRRTTVMAPPSAFVVGSSYTFQAAGAATYLSLGGARVFPAHRDRYDADDPDGQMITITALSGDSVTATLAGNPVDGLTRTIRGGDWILMNDTSVFLTVANEALIQSLMTAISALGGGTVEVAGGLGAITCTTGLIAKSNVFLDIRPGTYLQGVNGVNPISYSATAPSGPQTFTGTLTENTIGGTLNVAVSGLAVGDLAQITRTSDARPIQFMRVKTLATTVTPTFESSFAWPYTTAYDLRKVTTRLQNFKFRGEIRGTGTTGACRGIDILFFENLDLSEVITRDFAGNANSCAITASNGFGLRMDRCRDYDGSASGGSYASYQFSNVSDWKVTESSSYTRAGQPFQAVVMVDGYVSGNVWTGGGRTFELDTISGLKVYGDKGTNSGVAGGTGLSIESGAASVTETRHLSFFGVKYTNCSSYGLETFGGGATDIHFFGCDFRGNNIGAAAYDIGLLAGDDEIYLHDTLYGTITVGAAVNAYIYTPKVATYTATVRQSGALTTVTATQVEYTRNGAYLDLDFVLTVSNATGAVGANAIEIDLPAAAHANWITNAMDCGGGFLFDSSTGFYYPFRAQVVANSRIKLLPTSEYGVAIAYLGASLFTDPLAANDIIKGSVRYRVAS